MPQPGNDGEFEAPPSIVVRGARTHNLKSIDVDIPVGKLTVVTGVSGSGKSSLVFDTIYAEGRRRYLSSASMQSRELLQGVDRPDVELIDGLPPVLCVEQRMAGPRKRSTVGTTSDIHDFLRLLFSRVGKLHCPQCHQQVTSQSRTEIVAQALQSFDRQKVIVLAPLVRAGSANKEIFAQIVKDGYVKARVDGELVDAAAPPELSRSKPHEIDVVIDRLIMKPGIQPRLEESVDIALQLGKGQCVLSYETPGGWEDRLYSSQLVCMSCGTSFPSLEPRSFSFNSALGACPDCEGMGSITEPDETERVCPTCHGSRLGTIPRSVLIDGMSIAQFSGLVPADALRCLDQWQNWFPSAAASLSDASLAATRHLLPEMAARLRFLSEVGLDYLTLDRGCDSLSAGELQRVRLAACLGSELSGVCYILDEPTAGLHFDDMTRLLNSLLRLRDAGNTVLIVEHDLDVMLAADHVIDLGPGAGVLGGQVLAFGRPEELAENPKSVTGRYLDPNNREAFPGHRETAAIPTADEDLITRKTTQPASPRKAGARSKVNAISQGDLVAPPAPVLSLSGATLHNLKNVTVAIPLQHFVCVTGPSGSGKSSLIMQTLVPAVRQALGERIPLGGSFRDLCGAEHLSRLVRVDQSPLGRSSRSSPATYSGLWDDVRKVFAKTKESKVRGFTSKHFSLSVPEARCPRCAGRGKLPVDEKRFADWQILCPECDGKRFAPSTLSVRYRGKTVADVLEMSLLESATFFANFPRLSKILTVFSELGLGYLMLGQSASTLSGGESQRVKLGTELAKSSGLEGSTLFVLDEPTSGLHVADVQQLVSVLRRLVDEGHSILVIEHNRELISSAQWVIEIGPGAGTNGGNVVSSKPQQDQR